jgi:hypothetical protein
MAELRHGLGSGRVGVVACWTGMSTAILVPQTESIEAEINSKCVDDRSRQSGFSTIYCIYTGWFNDMWAATWLKVSNRIFWAFMPTKILDNEYAGWY